VFASSQIGKTIWPNYLAAGYPIVGGRSSVRFPAAWCSPKFDPQQASDRTFGAPPQLAL